MQDFGEVVPYAFVPSRNRIYHLIQNLVLSTTALIALTFPTATETISMMAGTVCALTRVRLNLSTTASAHHVRLRIKTVH